MRRTQSKRWHVKPRIPPSAQRRLRGFHPVMSQVLYNREMTDLAKAQAFLTGEVQDINPFKMAGMNSAVERIRQAIKGKEPIAVYGDFDTDGVTATVLLVQALRALGATVEPHIPHRIDDGYGLNTAALWQMSSDGYKLVITVDCGIRAVQEVKDAVARGLDVIVTDHHSVGPELPDAVAVIDPKQENCEYGKNEDMLAGVGVAYRLADALLRVARQNGEPINGLALEDLLDLVAVGTVADLAPLDRLENRVLVRQGLDVLNSARRPGFYALMDVAGLRPGKLRAMNIGYGLGPRLNAAGRLDSAILAYELLISDDMSEAMRLAKELQALNTRRQEETRSAQELARELALRDVEDDELPLIFAADESFLPGIVGLVAGRLAEEFYRPTVVIEWNDSGESRGSCRSVPEFNVIHALDQCADLLVRHGGHAQAAGFSIKNENLPALRERLIAFAGEALRGEDLRPTIHIDAEVPLEVLNLELAEELEQLEPTGHKNPAPLFATRSAPVLDYRTVGRDNNHLKLTLGEPGLRVDAIAFGYGEWAHDMPRRIDVAYHLEVNEWNGRRRAQMNVRDLRHPLP